MTVPFSIMETAELLYVAQALMRDVDLETEQVPVCELAYRLCSPLSPADMLEAARLPGSRDRKEWVFRDKRLRSMPRHGELAAGPQVTVYANHGRWLARCPLCTGDGVAAVQHASLTDPRFLCVLCGNHTVGGAYLPLAWPADDTRATVEQLLASRPVDARNWEPGDPLELVDLENTINGI